MGEPNLKQWRKYRGLTQKQVVDRLASMDDDEIPTTEASLSRIESGAQAYGPRILNALAFIYDCEVFELFSRDPIYEQERAEAIAKGDKVTDIREFTLLKANEQAQIVRLWNAMKENDTG